MRTILLAGAGGLGRETAQAIKAVNAISHSYRLVGFLDDAASRIGALVDGVRVLGEIADARRYSDSQVVLCLGRPGDLSAKWKTVDRLALPVDRYATIVHPAASLASDTRIGPGTVLLAGVTTTAGVSIGSHVTVMPQVVFTHDNLIADYATVGAGALFAGSIRVGRGAYVGSGARIREGLSIGAGAMLGMGAVATRSVPDGEVWIGCPARRVR